VPIRMKMASYRQMKETCAGGAWEEEVGVG
jgi:hypothetical protein